MPTRIATPLDDKPTGVKTERVDVRVAPETKVLLQRAAAIRGRSLSDFVVESAQEAAVAAVRDHQVMALTAEDSRLLAEIMLDPPEPTEALIRAFRRHRELIGDPDV